MARRPPGGVEGVVALHPVPGQNRQNRADQGFAGGGKVAVLRPSSTQRGGVEARLLARELPVGVGEGEERLVARLADGGALEAGVHLADAADGERAVDRIEAVDVLVERGRTDPQRFRQAGESDRLQSSGVGDPRRGIDNSVCGHSGARHVRSSTVAIRLVALALIRANRSRSSAAHG